MEWEKEIDQRLLMSIGELSRLLTEEAIRELCHTFTFDDMLEGKMSSTSDRMGKHQRAIVELLEKGCLLDKIHILRGDKKVLHDLCEVRNTIRDLRQTANIMSFYREIDSGLPQFPDTSNMLAGYMVAELALFKPANALEISPGEVVRWLNSVNEGQRLLPASLREYLAIEEKQKNEKPERPVQPRMQKGKNEITQKEAAEKLGVSPRTIRNWESGINTPDRYPGRRSLSVFLIFARDYDLDKALKKDARGKNRPGTGRDIDNLSDDADI